MDHRAIGWEGIHCINFDSGLVLVRGSCCYSNELLDSVTYGEFLDPSNHVVLRLKEE
jgi:hypothetical protein